MINRLLFLLIFVSQVQATTFTVTNTNNSGAGSLLQAILDANTAGGNCTIAFAIPGTGTQIIAPTTFYSMGAPLNRVYPPFTNNNIILDATTQPGFALGSPSVIIDCTAIPDSGSCLAIVGVDNCVIKGIGVENYVGSFSGRGISIENTTTTGANNNQITECVVGFITHFGNTRGIVLAGEYTPGGGAIANTLINNNVVSGNSLAGIQMQFDIQGTTIENNYIGCNFGGTVAQGNAYGIVFIGEVVRPCTNNTIQNNVLSGNLDFGIVLQAAVNNNTIQNNLVGLNGAGDATLGATGEGIYLDGDITDPCNNNTVSNNTIGGCTDNGIVITENASQNTVSNNYIGTNATGANLGNAANGILIQGDDQGPCVQNQITNNTIRFNGAFGIDLDGLVSDPDILNAMLENNISLNGANGIELQNNSNDNQLPPTIDSALVCGGTQVRVTVTAPSTPAASNFRIELFENPSNRNPITEGATYLTFIEPVASGQTVTVTFMSPISIFSGNYLSATATNLNNGGAPGDTSQYSDNVMVTQITPATINSFTAVPNSILAGESSTLTLDFTPGELGPLTAVWSDGVVETNVTSPIVRVVSPPLTTNYTVTLEDSSGCGVSSSVLVMVGNVNPLLLAIAAKYCPNS